MINQLYRNLGFEEAEVAIAMAAEKQDPREYIGAIMRKHTADRPPPLTEEEQDRLMAKYKAKLAAQQ